MKQTRELNNVLRDFGEYKVNKDLSKQGTCDINKKAAEILVKCGYADYKTDNGNYICWRDPEIDDTMEAVQIFSNTLEGRRQADTIEDWLDNHKTFSDVDGLSIWDVSAMKIIRESSYHQWRLDRIKWCLEELSK